MSLPLVISISKKSANVDRDDTALIQADDWVSDNTLACRDRYDNGFLLTGCFYFCHRFERIAVPLFYTLFTLALDCPAMMMNLVKCMKVFGDLNSIRQLELEVNLKDEPHGLTWRELWGGYLKGVSIPTSFPQLRSLNNTFLTNTEKDVSRCSRFLWDEYTDQIAPHDLEEMMELLKSNLEAATFAIFVKGLSCE